MGLVWSLIGKLFIIRINKVVQVQPSEIITSPHPFSSVLADNMYLLLVDKDKESAQQGHRLLINCMEQSTSAEAESSSESQVTVITTAPSKTCGLRGGVVVKALRYKPVGRGFDSRWCHWNFSVT